jgi:hypothetical protein
MGFWLVFDWFLIGFWLVFDYANFFLSIILYKMSIIEHKIYILEKLLDIMDYLGIIRNKRRMSDQLFSLYIYGKKYNEIDDRCV